MSTDRGARRRKAPHLPTVERGKERRLIHDAAAGGVDEHAAVLHQIKLLLAEKVLGRAVEGEVERDDVRDLEELVEGRDVGNAVFGLFGRKALAVVLEVS